MHGEDLENQIKIQFNHCYANDKQNPFTLDVDLRLPGNGVTTVFGRSGSGKTTLLRCIAGLQSAPSGQVIVKGHVWQNEGHVLPAHRRPVGYVFQEASLLPHLSVRKNLAFAMNRCGDPKIHELYEKVVQFMGIEKLREHMPTQLSGGERQRVAIAQALLIKPRLLLMDEPLASLDIERKQEILPYLERLRAQFDLPIIYVSHSIDEITRLADHVVVLSEGRVIAQGALTQIFAEENFPLSLGEEAGVVIGGTVVEKDAHWHLCKIAFSGGGLWTRDSGDALGQAVRIRILARDVSIALAPHEDTSLVNRLPAVIESAADDIDPAMKLVRLKSGDAVLIARITRRSFSQLRLKVGLHVWAQIKSAAVVR